MKPQADSKSRLNKTVWWFCESVWPCSVYVAVSYHGRKLKQVQQRLWPPKPSGLIIYSFREKGCWLLIKYREGGEQWNLWAALRDSTVLTQLHLASPPYPAQTHPKARSVMMLSWALQSWIFMKCVSGVHLHNSLSLRSLIYASMISTWASLMTLVCDQWEETASSQSQRTWMSPATRHMTRGWKPCKWWWQMS